MVLTSSSPSLTNVSIRSLGVGLKEIHFHEQARRTWIIERVPLLSLEVQALDKRLSQALLELRRHQEPGL